MVVVVAVVMMTMMVPVMVVMMAAGGNGNRGRGKCAGWHDEHGEDGNQGSKQKFIHRMGMGVEVCCYRCENVVWSALYAGYQPATLGRG